MERKVDVAIIGAGTAGLAAMGRVRAAGRSFVLIDGGELGTTCARVGCMPSKAAIQVAEDYARRLSFARMGIEGEEGLTLNVPDSMEHVRDLRDIFVDRVLAGTTDNLGEEFIEGHARFVAPATLQAGDDTVHAGRIIIATGSRPVIPPAWRTFEDRILTSDNLFEEERLPASVAAIGLGAIGLEMGQALHRMGVKVTGIDLLETIGGLRDPVVNQEAVALFGKEWPLWLGEAAEVKEQGGRILIECGGRSLIVEKILASMGRTPNLEGIGLEVLDCELNERGVPVFDPFTMQVGDLPVFIAGDVTGDRAILHEAAHEGRVAGINAGGDHVSRWQRPVLLDIAFCDPNIATVGARWDTLDLEATIIGEIRMGPVSRALIMGKNKGILRVYGDRGDGRILGGSMVAPRAENLAHLLAWCIDREMTVFDALKLPFYHPTMEEALQSVFRDMARQVDSPPPAPFDLRPA